jgi:DNA-binding transcriptional regulator YdaS (Cro superfamily)
MMSETPITQQAEAAVTRINQLTERMLTADRNAGADLAAAHEKAPQSLVDNPADLKQPVEWVQALAAVHAKFIEEATDALVKTAGEAASDVPVTGVLDEAEAQRIRSLNQQVLARPAPSARARSTGTKKRCRTWPTSKPRSRATASLTGCKLSPARTPNS